MVAQRRSYTFCVRYTPPEGDLLDEATLADMGHEEGVLVAQIFRYGMQRMHESFRTKVARALVRRLPADDVLDARTTIIGGAVELWVVCEIDEATDDTVAAMNKLLGDLVPRTWERVANRKR